MKTYPKPKTRSVITNAIALSVVSNVCFMQNDPDDYLHSTVEGETFIYRVGTANS